jgi:hypothetical protein
MQQILNMNFWKQHCELGHADYACMSALLDETKKSPPPTVQREFSIGIGKDFSQPVGLDVGIAIPHSIVSKHVRYPLQTFPDSVWQFSTRSMNLRMSHVETWLDAALALDLPIQCILYTIDFVDRTTHLLKDDTLLEVVGACALFLSQSVCSDFDDYCSLLRVLTMLGLKPLQNGAKNLQSARETCCRLLASLNFTVHGGGEEDPALWSTWKAMEAECVKAPACAHAFANVLVGLVVWPQRYQALPTRKELVRGCIGPDFEKNILNCSDDSNPLRGTIRRLHENILFQVSNTLTACDCECDLAPSLQIID